METDNYINVLDEFNRVMGYVDDPAYKVVYDDQTMFDYFDTILKELPTTDRASIEKTEAMSKSESIRQKIEAYRNEDQQGGRKTRRKTFRKRTSTKRK